MRKKPALSAATIQGRPMANLGLKRLNKKLRHQVKTVLNKGGLDFRGI